MSSGFSSGLTPSVNDTPSGEMKKLAILVKVTDPHFGQILNKIKLETALQSKQSWASDRWMNINISFA
jgi:hypothetical protein